MDSWITNAKQIQILISQILPQIHTQRKRERESGKTPHLFLPLVPSDENYSVK